MRSHPLPVDFLVRSPEGRLVAAVEAKRRLGTTPEWAARLKTAMLASGELGELGEPLFFVVVVPDKIYIWTSPANESLPIIVDARVELASYYERVAVDADHIYPMAFENLVWLWLRELTMGLERARTPELVDSGLDQAVENGHLVYEDAA
ncbi:MAG: hypothetical protein AAGF11_12120 [Myxococcota bacterium]